MSIQLYNRFSIYFINNAQNFDYNVKYRETLE